MIAMALCIFERSFWTATGNISRFLTPPIVKYLPDILVAEEIKHMLSFLYRTHYEIYLYTVYTLGIRII